MTYVRFDDTSPDHAKVAAVGDAAFRLWFTAICVSSRLQTDGVLTAAQARRLGGPRQIAELVNAKLFDVVEGGFAVHDYLVHQRSRAQVDEERTKARERWSRYAKPSGEVPPKFARTSPKQSMENSASEGRGERGEVDPTSFGQDLGGGAQNATPPPRRPPKAGFVEISEEQHAQNLLDFPDFDVPAELENCRNLRDWRTRYTDENKAFRNRLRLKREDGKGSNGNGGNSTHRGPAASRTLDASGMAGWDAYAADTEAIKARVAARQGG